MTEYNIDTENNDTNKTRLQKFYEKNKKYIYTGIGAILLFIAVLFFYIETKKGNLKEISESYVSAKIYLANGEKNKAKQILIKNIYLNNSTYSTLSLFLIINENLVDEKKEVVKFFEHILENCKFDKEVKNLLIFKKTLFQSDYLEEAEILNSLNPLINGNSIWKHHALLLLADYYLANKEKNKAKEFYEKILKTENLSQEFYSKVKLQISQTTNE